MITRRNPGAARRSPRPGAGHDRGRVAVGQDHAVHLLTEGAHGLRAAIVELGRLANDDGPRAQDEDAL